MTWCVAAVEYVVDKLPFPSGVGLAVGSMAVGAHGAKLAEAGARCQFSGAREVPSTWRLRAPRFTQPVMP